MQAVSRHYSLERQCFVKNCHRKWNRSLELIPKTLHRLPDDRDFPFELKNAEAKQREAWLRAVGREDLIDCVNTPLYYVCARHFHGKTAIEFT